MKDKKQNVIPQGKDKSGFITRDEEARIKEDARNVANKNKNKDKGKVSVRVSDSLIKLVTKTKAKKIKQAMRTQWLDEIKKDMKTINVKCVINANDLKLTSKDTGATTQVLIPPVLEWSNHKQFKNKVTKVAVNL